MADAKQRIEDLLHIQLQDDSELFLVEIKVIPGNNVKVFIDGDNGVSIDRCTKIHKALYRQIEEEGIFPNNDFSLEVSSPGTDEPLKLLRQYKKNIGRTVEVSLNDGSKKEGNLTGVNEDAITIRENQGSGKKRPVANNDKTTNILFDQIKHTKVLVTF